MKKNILSERTKHVDNKNRMIVDCVKKGTACLEYAPSQDNLAGIFTKAVGKVSFSKF